MEWTRRALFGVGAVVVGTAGCLGAEGVEYPEESEPPADDDDDPPDDPPDSDDPDEPGDTDDDPPVANAALADATRRVVDDAVWFATAYPDAVAAYRDAVDAAVATIDSVRTTVDEDGTMPTAQVDALEEAVETAASSAGDALEPHFSPGPRIRSVAQPHVETLRTIARRDDVDRALEELDRLHREFASLGTAPYVEERFSRTPVFNRLFDRLLAPLPSDDDERDRIRRETLVEVALPTRSFSTFAHRPYDRDETDRDRVPRIYGDAFDDERRRELRARLGPIPRANDRTEELFVAFATRPPAGNRPEETFRGWARELDGVPAYVQRYPDAETAESRLSTVLEAGETEGRAPIDPGATRAGSDFDGNGSAEDDGDSGDGESDDGPTAWHRFYHREAEGERYGYTEHDGVQYGYVVRAGEFLLATGFSGDAWEERAGWQGRLRHGWVTGA